MKVLIWLGCIVLYSIVQTVLLAAGIRLGGVPTALLALLLVFLPAPVLCKKWGERKKQKSMEHWHNCPKCGQLIRDGESCDCESQDEEAL